MADEWDDALADDTQPPMFPSVEAWVHGWLAPVIRRPAGRDTAWCPEWWRHPEAIVRLEALWRSWEHLRTDSTTGMSVWVRDHLDPHLGFLRDRNVSPFSRCDAERGHDEEDPLTVTPAPPGWWGTSS